MARRGRGGAAARRRGGRAHRHRGAGRREAARVRRGAAAAAEVELMQAFKEFDTDQSGQLSSRSSKRSARCSASTCRRNAGGARPKVRRQGDGKLPVFEFVRMISATAQRPRPGEANAVGGNAANIVLSAAAAAAATTTTTEVAGSRGGRAASVCLRDPKKRRPRHASSLWQDAEHFEDEETKDSAAIGCHNCG